MNFEQRASGKLEWPWSLKWRKHGTLSVALWMIKQCGSQLLSNCLFTRWGYRIRAWENVHVPRISFIPCTLLTHDLHGINPLEMCSDHSRVLYIQVTQTAGHYLSSSCSQCVSDSWMLCEVCNLIYWFTTVPIPALNLLWAFGMTSCSSPFKVLSLRIGR